MATKKAKRAKRAKKSKKKARKAARKRAPARRKASRGGAPTKGAAAAGKAAAKAIIEARSTRPRRRARGPRPVLLAEGDSWFDYPFFDTLEELEDDFGYRVESVAHKGDTVEDMAFSRAQLDALYRKFERLQGDGHVPKAILLSGGGNDIAGDEFAVLLNHKDSGLDALSETLVRGLVDERLHYAVASLASSVTALSDFFFGKKIPMLIHGYDYPVPDGRGYMGGMWILPGPWLEPGFRRKGFADMKERVAVMVRLIDRYNDVLASLAGSTGLRHLHHVDLRNTLSNTPASYQKWWNDELHPTRDGFRRVAKKFHEILATV